MASFFRLVALCVLAGCLLVHATVYPLPNSDDDKGSLVPLEQHIAVEQLRYKLWRQAVERGTTDDFDEQDSSLDLDLFEEMRRDAPPVRNRWQERQWRSEQRARALNPAGYDPTFTARPHDILPLHYRDSRDGRLGLPSPSDTDSITSTALTEHIERPLHDETVIIPTGVKALRQFLAERGVECENCVELRDLVERAAAVRHLPTKQDLAVSEMSGTPLFAFNGLLNDRAGQIEELVSHLEQQSPQAAEVVHRIVAQRAMLRVFSRCQDPNVDWLGNFNSTVPSGCTLTFAASM